MSDFVELRQIITVVGRWWWLLILSTLIAGAVGYGISQRQSPVYQASATVMVGQSIQAAELTKTDLQTGELLAQTYADIAQRQPILRGVIQALNLDITEQALKKQIRVEQVSGTQLLEIKAEAGSPEAAQAIANEIAQQLILQSPTHLQGEGGTELQQYTNQRLENLLAKIQQGKQRLNTLEVRMNDYFSVDQLKELQDEINTLENQIFDWEDKYTELLIFTAGQQSPNQLRIIEQASAGETPVRPRPKIHVLLASVLGVLFALGFVVVREYLDYTIKTTAELSKHLNLTSLGAVRRIQGKSAKDKLITSEDFFAPWSESYRMIRSNIQFMTIDKPIRSVLITSSLPGEGKSTTAANLGVVMAQADLKTIIIDSDLRRPTQHKIFQLPNTDGLTDLLRASEPDLNHYLKETAIPNLYVLPSGTLPSNPSELLGSQRMSRLLTDLREFADVIIADSPPVIAFTDAAVLSTRMDGVVLVTLAGQTRLDIVRQAIRNLRQVGASLLGAVLNGTASKDEALYYQAYYSTNNVNGHGQTHSPVRLPGSKQWRQRLAFKEPSGLKFNTYNEDSGEN